MNIFKVMASGRKSFTEESASAILAWLMNPKMEHGLGYTFISKFIDRINKDINNSDLSKISKNSVQKLRENPDAEDSLTFSTYLEYNVETAFIDIVFEINDWIFAVENKIYQKSYEEGQLIREYAGLKKAFPDNNIGIIYLIPIELDLVIPKFQDELDKLTVNKSDFKTMVTWQKSSFPSISEIIEQILDEESKGHIDPLNEYTRHTLKAFNSFIINQFSGYNYTKSPKSSGMNPLAEKDRLTISKINEKTSGYVGVNGGVAGLIRISNILNDYLFQYSSQDMSNKNNWIDIENFKKIVNWLLNETISEIDWDNLVNTLDSESLFKIAMDFKGKVFIGIRGGLNSLNAMSPIEIKEKKWGISTTKSTNQWIDGETFYK
ncbi:MAG: PD-(D/E)XK nuclease family protein, partial [Nitrospirae bacterium]|nr:PD-(D/E)XK nuclease family protein [Nitrospirota bacterium]